MSQIEIFVCVNHSCKSTDYHETGHKTPPRTSIPPTMSNSINGYTSQPVLLGRRPRGPDDNKERST